MKASSFSSSWLLETDAREATALKLLSFRSLSNDSARLLIFCWFWDSYSLSVTI